MTPETLSGIFERVTKPYGLLNQKSFEKRSFYSVYNGTKTLSFTRPKIWDLLLNEIKV